LKSWYYYVAHTLGGIGSANFCVGVRFFYLLRSFFSFGWWFGILWVNTFRGGIYEEAVVIDFVYRCYADIVQLG
jgi:hypothetical protein